MNFIQKQKIDKQQLSIFLRDLSSNINVNLKHMIEDSVEKYEHKNKKKNYNKNKNKKKVIKKKDLIIQAQNEKKMKKNIEDDKNKIEYLFESSINEDPFYPLTKLKTEEGILEYQLKLLSHFWENKKENMKYIILLFFSLKDKIKNNEIVNKVDNLLDNYDYHLYMMKEVGDMLPPLNYWEKKSYSFEDWQIKVINHVKKKESVIVKAPTSSGKSFIAMSSGIFHKKILYICPAKPVVYQVGSHFIHMGYKVHFLVDNLSHYSYDSKTNIFIGTPFEVENNILNIGTNFDYVVFDEIHNLNKKEDGDIYENLLKMIPCNFLALSATIKNIEFLKEIFQKINPDKKINYIEYNQRFINHQRWIWNENKLKKLHPLSGFDKIDDNFLKSPITYTPNDCACLWEQIDNIFEEIDEETDILDGCSPDDYFDKRLVTLNDCRDYERFIKQKLVDFNCKYPNEVRKVLDHFQENVKVSDEDEDNIIDFIHNVKKEDMFPMIMFNTDEQVCKGIFHHIYKLLNDNEEKEYPYHYDILKKKDELFQEYLTKRETYKSNIKVHSTNPNFEIKEKMDIFDNREKNSFIKSVIDFYEQKIKYLKSNDNESQLINLQISNLKEEMNQFIMNPDFNLQDIFQKHKKFIFTKTNKPMDADTIRNIRREIKKTLGIKISYESPLFQMLKRGIGLYIENMPDEYNWILQKLLSDKEIGIVISDKTLCLGIDLPVRSSCFLGINKPFTREEYLQMSGRAGRRGMDNKGNIIFYGNIDYRNLMRGELPEIIGNHKSIYENYKVFKNFEPVLNNMIHKDRKVLSVPNFKSIDEKNKKLLWNIRIFKNSFLFLDTLKTIEKTLFNQNEGERYITVLNNLSELIGYSIDEPYKLKKINDPQDIIKVKTYLQTIQMIHNSINYKYYYILMDVYKEVFNNLNRMLYNTMI